MWGTQWRYYFFTKTFGKKVLGFSKSFYGKIIAPSCSPHKNVGMQKFP
jgi:hypothetical protein